MSMSLVSNMGGILVILIFVHFIADWIMQTDAMARRKAEESPWLLIIHSIVYSVTFIPILVIVFDCSISMVITSFLALMMSHGAIDTYTPIWLWARFVRRPMEMKNDPIKGFSEWSSKTRGILLVSGVDQLMHILFLASISFAAVIAENDEKTAELIGSITLAVAIGIAILSVVTILTVWNKKSAKTNFNNGPNNDIDEYERHVMPSQHDE